DGIRDFHVTGVQTCALPIFYMRADWVAQNKGIVQRVVNAYVKTLKWIATHSPAEIADKLPADYYAGDKDLYLTALTGSMPMFSRSEERRGGKECTARGAAAR